jgi:hypothetical protein
MREFKYMENKKSYYAIIPADVRYDKKLKANAKLLYGEITALCNEKGYCWANNQYFAKLYEVNTLTISRWISQLSLKGYIKISVDIAAGNKRKIKLNATLKRGRVLTKKSIGIDEIINHNTTLNNKSKKDKLTKQEKISVATYDFARVEYLKEQV